MTGLRRSWLLWRASRLRRKADAVARRGIDTARALRKQADDCEREANRLLKGLS